MLYASLRSALVGYILLLASSNQAFADPYLERFGVSARLKGMAATGIALSNDYSSVYINPANLPYCQTNQLTFELASLGSRIYSNLDGNDVDTEQVSSAVMAQAGACFKLPYNIGVGFYFNLNAANPVTLHVKTLDDRVRFALYDASLAIPSIGVGIGYAPIKWLSFGLGISLSALTSVNQTVNVPVPPQKSTISVAGDVSPLVPVSVGITAKPIKSLSASIVYRSVRFSKFESIGNYSLTHPSINLEMVQRVESVVGFAPHQVGLGLSYEIINGLLIAADVTWYKWSDYTSPFLRITPGESALSRKTANFPDEEDFNFRDIYVPTFGIEYVWKDMISVRAGYGYRMSPAPTPQGVANLIDIASHIASIGNGYKVKVKNIAIATDIFFAFHFFPETDFIRPSGAQYQTITSYGVVWNAGANLSLYY